jgi:hypothetical protein
MSRAFVIPNLIVSAQLRDVDVVIERLRLSWIEWKSESVGTYGQLPEGRLVILTPDDEGEREALWIADILMGLLDLIHMESGRTLRLIEVPPKWIAAGALSAKRVEALVNPMSWGRPSDIEVNFWPTDRPISKALRFLPAVIASAGRKQDTVIPGAILYYKVSTAEHAFIGDSVSLACGEAGDESPPSAFERIEMEDALHNAFKALEALIGGEPPKDTARFRKRLELVGVDPDDPVGFRGRPKEPLVEVLKRIWATRDKRAAHAGRTPARNRSITYFELMEAQHAVAYAIGQAVMSAAGEPQEPQPTDS